MKHIPIVVGLLLLRLSPGLAAEGLLPAVPIRSGRAALVIWDATAVALQTPAASPSYNSDMRPDSNGKPTRVSIRIDAIDISAIDDATQAVISDFSVVIRWQDERLASTNAGERTIGLTEVWHPAFEILNQRGFSKILPDEVTVDGRGQVIYRQRYIGSFAIRLSLADFPLDHYVASLGIGFQDPPEQLELVRLDSRGNVDFSILDWDIGPAQERVDVVESPT